MSRSEGADGLINFTDFLDLSHTFSQRQLDSIGSVEPVQHNYENVESIFDDIKNLSSS